LLPDRTFPRWPKLPEPSPLLEPLIPLDGELLLGSTRDESWRLGDEEDPLILSSCDLRDESFMPSDLRSVISANPHC